MDEVHIESVLGIGTKVVMKKIIKKLYKIILSETHKKATRNLQKFAKEKIKKKHTPLKFKEKFDKINHSEEEKYASRASAAEFFKLIFN